MASTSGGRQAVVVLFVVAVVAAIPYAIKLAATRPAAGPGLPGSAAVTQERPAAAGQLTVIDFYTDWCGWCKKLDAETYPDPRVKQEMKRFGFRKVNPEKDPGGKELAEKYGVNGFPTIVVVDADGKAVKTIVGYRPPEDFVADLKSIPAARG